MTKLEERIRSGLHHTAERIPESVTHLDRRRRASGRASGIWMGAAAIVGLLVLFSPFLLLNGSEPAFPPGEASTPSTGAPATTTVDAEFAQTDRFPVVVEVEATGDLIGLQRGHVFRSTDGGQSWREILVDGDADLLDVAPDGTVIAVSNSEQQDATEALGADSSVWAAPKVHVYGPGAEEWQTTALPRPDFPVDNPRPAPMDGSGDCPKGNIQWTLQALSVAIGDRYVIAGEQRITEATICDQSYQIFWTSEDGESWTVIEPTGVPGLMVGITALDDTYIAYGSEIPWYSMDSSKTVEVWTSSDLASWATADIDLSVLPTNGYANMFPDEEAAWGIGGTVVATLEEGMLRLDIPIGLAAPGPAVGIADIEELNQWAEANDRITVTRDIVESLGIDFPLDDQEADKLRGYFHIDEGRGSLVLETTDGITWASRYESR